MVGWIKVKLGTEVGLGTGHFVFDQHLAPTKGYSPKFSAHVCCAQMAGWINMPLGTEIGLGPGDIVLDWNPAPPTKGAHQPTPLFGPCIVAKRLDGPRYHLVRR